MEEAVGADLPPAAPKAREGEVEGLLPPPGGEATPRRRSISPRGLHLLQKFELEAPGGVQRANRIAAARMEMTRESKGGTAFERVLHVRRAGSWLRFDTTRPLHPNGRSLLTSAQPDSPMHRQYGAKRPDPAFRLPQRRSAEEILAEDRRLTAQGKGRSFAKVAGDYLSNLQRDAAFREKERQEAEWARASMTDPLVGGFDGHDKRAIARSALNAFGDPGLHHYLDDTGLGNHPAILRLFYRAGKAIAHRPMPPTVEPPD